MNKKSFMRAKILFFSVLMVMFVLLEFEAMINYYDNFTYFAGLGFLILIDAYLLTSVLIKRSDMIRHEKEEHMQTVQNSEKASYLLLKKNFQDLDVRIGKLEEKMNPLPGMMERNEYRVAQVLTRSMEEQKKISKMLLSLSKENTEALMNSNDVLSNKFEQMDSLVSARMDQVSGITERLDLLESKTDESLVRLDTNTEENILKVSSQLEEGLQQMKGRFEEKIDQLESRIDRQMGEFNSLIENTGQKDSDSQIKTLEARQEEMVSYLKQLELSLKNEIMDAVDKISSIQPRVVVTGPPIPDIALEENQNTVHGSAAPSEEVQEESEEFTVGENELSMDDLLGVEERTDVEELPDTELLDIDELSISDGLETAQPQAQEFAGIEETTEAGEEINDLLDSILPEADAEYIEELTGAEASDSDISPSEELDELTSVEDLLAGLLPTEELVEEETTDPLPELEEEPEAEPEADPEETEVEPVTEPEETEIAPLLELEDTEIELLPEQEEAADPLPQQEEEAIEPLPEESTIEEQPEIEEVVADSLSEIEEVTELLPEVEEPEPLPEPETIVAESKPLPEPETIVAEPKPEQIDPESSAKQEKKKTLSEPSLKPSKKKPAIAKEMQPEVKVEKPELSNPNKIMSPEEIAALIANVGGSDSTPEPEPEHVMEEPVVEDKPPMPDLSNPNKVMTPEEIAALIANM